MEILCHLSNDMFCLMIILNLQVCRDLCNLVSIAADRAEPPLLEPVDIGKGLAPRATEDEVHGNFVMRAVLIKIYR